MSFPYRNNMNNIPQPPLPPPMLSMGLMNHGYEAMHQNFNMNPGMMVPGMNDTPLEFNMSKPPLPPIHMHPPPPMDKTNSEDDFQQRLNSYEQNIVDKQLNINDSNGNSNDSRGGNNRKRSRDRDNRRRDRKDDDKVSRDRVDRRSDQKGRQSDLNEDRNNQNKDGKGNSSLNKLESDSKQNTQPTPQQGMIFGGMGMGGMYPGNMMGMMGGMMMDPSMMAMGQYSVTDPTQMTMGQPGALPIIPPEGVTPLTNPDVSMGMIGMNNFNIPPTKETITLKSCTLVPPYPSSVLPTQRDKPPGCRTIFVGSLPENINEEILTEIFERCGEITSMRLSKKNFCHIRFAYEQSVDAAIFFSGYRIKIENKTDAANSSRLHVDYAMARDDQHEWECKQRALQREQRHREKMAARRRPPSPPPINHYTDHDAFEICDKIKQDENFNEAAQVVISWLERGDCNKRNVNTFYSMIQSANSHVRRLLNDKTQMEEELQRVKDETRVKMQTLLLQFGQVEKVFAAASLKKVWDHFSKAQRKNIEMWKKQSSEIRVLQLEDFLQETGGGEEMDVSDEEGSPKKKTKQDEELKEENDSLKCQLEAYRNEIEVLKTESKYELHSKLENIQELKNRLNSLESQLTLVKREYTMESVKVKMLEARLANEIKLDTQEAETMNRADKDAKSTKDPVINEKEAKLIGVISTFLNVHPFGASIDYLWSYVQKMEPDFGQNQLEELLRKFPTVFLQIVSGVGANIERKWMFNGYSSVTD